MTVASHLTWNFSSDPYQRWLDPNEAPSSVCHNDLRVRMRSRFAFPRAARWRQLLHNRDEKDVAQRQSRPKVKLVRNELFGFEVIVSAPGATNTHVTSLSSCDSQPVPSESPKSEGTRLGLLYVDRFVCCVILFEKIESVISLACDG
jgi:hypothetical protein